MVNNWFCQWVSSKLTIRVMIYEITKIFFLRVLTIRRALFISSFFIFWLTGTLAGREVSNLNDISEEIY